MPKKYDSKGRTDVKYDFEEFVDENENAGKDDYDFASVGEECEFSWHRE